MARIEIRPPSVDGPHGPHHSPWRAFLLGAVLIVVVVAVVLFVLRTFAFPIFESNSEATRAEATARTQLDALRTQQAVVPAPTAAVRAPAAVAQTPVLATPVPTQQPVVPRAPATVQATATMAPGAAVPTALPTVPPELDAEISQAYLHYFQVTSDALLALDPSGLDQVAANGELTALENDIEDDRAQGRVLQTNVQHRFIVLSAEGDNAQVADRYRDSSIYVDPSTHEPLPGQVVPSSPDNAPEVRVIYQLRRIDGAWKVTGGQKYE